MLQRSVSDGSASFEALCQVPFLAFNRGVVFSPTNGLCSGNPIVFEGAEAIAGALRDKTSLSHLDLSDMCAGLVCGGQILWRIPWEGQGCLCAVCQMGQCGLRPLHR